MIYVTKMQVRKPYQVSWEDVLFDEVNIEKLLASTANERVTATYTRKMWPTKELLDKTPVNHYIRLLENFNRTYEELFKQDRKTLYHHFEIPKKTGGWRPIDAPEAHLQLALRELARILTKEMHVLYHTSAFAYVPGRSTVQCMQKHQANNSKWFLKTDFSGFFPKTTLEFTMKMLEKIYPTSEICKVPEGREALEKALSLGFLNGGLPQGTALSPVLTNMFMIPIDHALFNYFANAKIVYTRYADDMFISAQEKFPWEKAVKHIREVLAEFDAPYLLKDEKTRFGSSAGSNWNLGLMLNKDNDITVGYRTKKYFKAALTNLILDTKHGKPWDVGDVFELNGKLSYYKMVEPQYFANLVKRSEEKWKVSFVDILKQYNI